MILNCYHPPQDPLPEGIMAQGCIALSFDERSRSRFKINLLHGDINVSIARGQVIRHGAHLSDGEHYFVQVLAKDEPLLRVSANTPQQLLQAAYHLGNRHVKLEIHADYLQCEYDAVLADMLTHLGVRLEPVHAAFEPEMGAYGGGHQHGHDETFADDYALAQAAFHQHSHS